MSLGLGLGLSRKISSSAFTPLDISGGLVWYDASDESSITASGSNVSQIDDKTGNGNHGLSNTTANQPQTGTVIQNGLNTLAFTNDYLSLDGTTAATALSGVDAQNCTLYLAVQENSANTSNAAVIGMKSTVGADLYAGKLGTLDRTYVFGNSSSTFEFVTPSIVTEDAFHIIVITTSSSTGLTIWVDGVKTVVDATAVSGVTWDAFWVARRYSGVLNDMCLGELAIYDSELPQADIDALNGYGVDKWGV